MTLGFGGFFGWWFGIQSQPTAPGITPHPFWTWQPVVALIVGVLGLLIVINKHRHPTPEEEAARLRDAMSATQTVMAKQLDDIHKSVITGGGAVDTPPRTPPTAPPPHPGSVGGGTVDIPPRVHQDDADAGH